MSQALSLTSKLLARYPWVSNPFVVSAPMRVMAGPALALTVSQFGGLGFIGPGAKTEDTNKDLDEASALVSTALSSSGAFTKQPHRSSHLPVGVGFQMWADDVKVALAGVEKHAPCATWLFAPRNGPRDYDEWSKQIRNVSAGTQVWIQIGTLKEAKELLLNSEKPDVVVVQGAESGGHGRKHDGLGLMTLLPEISDALAGSQIPLLAAGGIADGRGVAAALCLGASGAVMGTRFLAATQARITKGYQNEIVRASDGAASTTRTVLYNHLRGTFGWPDAWSPRTIFNRSFIEEQEGKSFDELKKLHDEALKTGDAGWGPEGRLATYAGASVGLIHSVEDAEAILRKVRVEYAERLQNLNSVPGDGPLN